MYHSFDTHKVIKNFIKSGITEPQAEAIVMAISSSRDADMSNLATKADIMELKEDMMEMREEHRSDIAEVKACNLTLKAEIAGVESRLSIEIAEVKSCLFAEIHKTKSQLLFWFLAMIIGTTTTSIGALATLGFWFFEHYLVK